MRPARALVTLLPLAAAGALIATPGLLDRYQAMPHPGLTLRLVAGAVAALVMALAAWLRQGRLALLALLTLGFAVALSVPALPRDEASALVLAFVAAASCCALVRLRERGAATPTALVRAALLAALLAATGIALALGHAGIVNVLARAGSALAPLMGTSLTWPTLALVFLACGLALRRGGLDAATIGLTFVATLAALLAATSAMVAGSALQQRPLAVEVLGLAAAACAGAGLLATSWRRLVVDDLTGLPGRRALHEHFERLSGTYAIAAVDVDGMSALNSRHGRDAGDEALRLVAARLVGCHGGTAYRQGGDEFVVVATGKALTEVVRAMEVLRATLASRPFGLRQRRGSTRQGFAGEAKLTVSVGLAQVSERCPRPDDVLASAEAALMRARGKGPDRVEVEKRTTHDRDRKGTGPSARGGGWTSNSAG